VITRLASPLSTASRTLSTRAPRRQQQAVDAPLVLRARSPGQRVDRVTAQLALEGPPKATAAQRRIEARAPGVHRRPTTRCAASHVRHQRGRLTEQHHAHQRIARIDLVAAHAGAG
jgi:hypothetical protein